MVRGQFRVAVERVRCAAARRLGLNVNILSSAAFIEELHVAETVVGPPCIVLPGQFDRISAGAFEIDVTREIAELNGAPRALGATVRYVLENVIAHRGVLYGHGGEKLFNHDFRLKWPKAEWRHLDQVALRSSLIGCYYFGEWLWQDSATHLLAEADGRVVSMPTPSWAHKADYLSVFGQNYSEIESAHIKRLTLFDDIAQNSHKANRLRALRARVAGIQKRKRTRKIVYLMRGEAGKSRRLVNEEEVLRGLESRGVVIVEPEKLGVAELIEQLFDSEMIIGVEGSQLCHAIFTLRDGGGVIAIQPPDRFFNSHMDWSRALDMRYGIVVGQQREAGFYLSAEELLRTIELMDHASK